MNLKILLTIAGVGTLALLALDFVFRSQASANDGPTCTPSTGFIHQFCVNVPVGTSVRRETTVPLSTVLTARADVRIEAGVPAPEVVRLASSVDNAIARVERAFDRPFTTKPRNPRLRNARELRARHAGPLRLLARDGRQPSRPRAAACSTSRRSRSR